MKYKIIRAGRQTDLYAGARYLDLHRRVYQVVLRADVGTAAERGDGDRLEGRSPVPVTVGKQRRKVIPN